MSSSAPRSGERMIHQDFIARIRYSNALPPPPNPPKLLDIPNTGLASGQYTNPGFASRLAREQPLNIEADAELGMPLDLVGMPGVFDGDERSIQAPAQQPPIHPHDRLLLRPITALGKHKVAEASVSFLRRTEYISSLTPKRQEAGNPRALLAKNKKIARRAPEASADSPQAIKRKIDDSFAAAERDLKDTKKLKHPSKKHVQLVDAMPLVPDLDAFPDSGAYVTIKFLTNPIQGSRYDQRLTNGLFRPIDRTKAEEQAFDAALKAHEEDPERNPKPPNLMNYDFYLGESAATSEKFRSMFDTDNPNHHDTELYTNQSDGNGCFSFKRVRAYETAQETEYDHPTKYSEEVLLAFNDKDDGLKQKGMYYYPIMQKSTIRPQRTKNIARTVLAPEDEEQIVDQLDITVEDPNEDMKIAMDRYRIKPLEAAEDPAEEAGPVEEELEELDEVPKEEGADDNSDNEGAVAVTNGDSAAARRRNRSVSADEEEQEEEEDAEGEQDED